MPGKPHQMSTHLCFSTLTTDRPHHYCTLPNCSTCCSRDTPCLDLTCSYRRVRTDQCYSRCLLPCPAETTLIIPNDTTFLYRQCSQRHSFHNARPRLAQFIQQCGAHCVQSGASRYSNVQCGVVGFAKCGNGIADGLTVLAKRPHERTLAFVCLVGNADVRRQCGVSENEGVHMNK